MDEALGRLKRTIVRMDEWINSNNGDFMMGDQLTYADISVMPLIIRMEDINLSNYWDDYSSIGRWLDRIKNHGAFKDTYYKGSLLSEKYPHLKFDN
jgi:glutathione S-transferase